MIRSDAAIDFRVSVGAVARETVQLAMAGNAVLTAQDTNLRHVWNTQAREDLERLRAHLDGAEKALKDFMSD